MHWLALIVITALAASVLTVPLVRAYDARRVRPEQTLPHHSGGGRQATILAIGGLALAIIALAGGLYIMVGRPASIAAAAAGSRSAEPAGAHPGGDIASMVVALESRMKQDPGDVAGWRMLGWSYMQTGRYTDAVSAYAKVLALAPGSAEDDAAFGEALTRTAGGAVTPSADEAFRRALSLNPREPRARYYLAVAKEQRGDHKGAMTDWIDLLRSAPAGAPWVAPVRGYVEEVAKADGEDIAGRLPSATPSAAGAVSGAMIERMVDSLESRLKSNPNDPDGWVQLIRSRMVLGETSKAVAAYHQAWRALADFPAQQDRLQAAARDLHVPGA